MLKCYYDVINLMVYRLYIDIGRVIDPRTEENLMNGNTSTIKFNAVMGAIFSFLTVFNATVHLAYGSYLDSVIAAVRPDSSGHHVIEAISFTLIFEAFAFTLIISLIHALYVQQCEFLSTGISFSSADNAVAA